MEQLEQKRTKLGRPRFFDTPEEMEAAIEQYLEDVDNGKEELSLSGLATGIGFAGIQGIYNYRNRYPNEFDGLLARARAVVEKYYEVSLVDPKKSKGAQFALERMFGLIERREDKVIKEYQVTLGAEERRLLAEMGGRLVLEGVKTVNSTVIDNAHDDSRDEAIEVHNSTNAA